MEISEEIKARVEYEFSHRYNHTLHAYIDIAGDLVAGTLLSQIMYWFSESKSTKQLRVKVFKDGKHWLAKQRSDWYDEIRITERQYDTAIKKLEDKGFVELKKYKFNSLPTIHIRPIFKNVNDAVDTWKEAIKQNLISGSANPITKASNGNYQNVNSLGNYENSKTGITDAVSPLTGNTNSDSNNRDYSSENTNKAFSKEKVNYKDYKAFFEKKVACVETKLPYNYNKKEFDDFIREKVNQIITDIDPEEISASGKVSKIISAFYDEYVKKRGERHPILSDAAYTSVVIKLLQPIQDIIEKDYVLNVERYQLMIERFFDTDYGKHSGNRTDYRISYFFQDAVQRNLMYKTEVEWF